MANNQNGKFERHLAPVAALLTSPEAGRRQVCGHGARGQFGGAQSDAPFGTTPRIRSNEINKIAK
jgi:hypothetical protein